MSATDAPDGVSTVLVADDEESSQRELRTMLERGAYRVILAGDGAAALRTLAAHECDLVLCEAVLPDMDGFEVCKAIKQAPATREIPVVLLMSGDDEGQRERAIQAGADDVAIKPIDRARLLALVRVQLRIAGLNRQLNKLESVVVTLARAVEDRDHTSAGLSEKVAHWAIQLGTAIELPDDQLTLLYRAALLHDVGTVSVPVDVLSKQGRLDPGEFSQVKRHPIVGEEILSALPSAEQVLPAARHHTAPSDSPGSPDALGE